MTVTMMNIGKMGMFVHHADMRMPVAVGFLAIPLGVVVVVVMLIMLVWMLMFLEFMRMFMGVALGQMQPYANRHQSTSQPEGR